MRHHRFGEGEYEESERTMRRLLTETGAATSTAASFLDAGVETFAFTIG